MVVEKASAPEGRQTLLRHAATVVRTRGERGGYAGVSPADAAELSSTLESIAATADDDGVDHEEAVALAHRLVDDDHPELSPMWPGTAT
ncbi:hypothetical protein GCM10023201_43810 [Actinomycetospora corticicola]|uniref:Uncharacterized protein n=1 Tax=Actinomycetospora corticicola TaxID=663602 RepID=A0A7Y9DWK1_9PSEU|nr:hypothetical protein [Actinomycetospora corticicola]NYD36527.1 hypothetical protein [Actinomycetospora corticicola]